MQKEGVGFVDGSADAFLSHWVRRQFDKWCGEAGWKCSLSQFPVIRKELEARIDNDFKRMKGDYEDEVKAYELKKKRSKTPSALGPEPVKPDFSDVKKESMLRAAFLREAFPKVSQLNVIFHCLYF